ncbi:hypothetical protein D3C87_1807250 [compost metagenome]
MQAKLTGLRGQLKLLRHVGNQLAHRKAFALRFDAAIFQAREFKQLLRKMPHLLPLSQRRGQILLALFCRQGRGFHR